MSATAVAAAPAQLPRPQMRVIFGGLTEALADNDADRRPEVSALLTRLARELCGEPPAPSSDAAPAVVA